MTTYRVVIVKSTQKEVLKFPQKDKKRIVEALTALSIDPFRGKQLRGDHAGKWSLRVWPYRIIYMIEKKIVTVTILRIGHRKDVYKNH